MGKKHKGLPQGMNYAKKLARDRMVKEAVEKAAQDETTQIRADIKSQQLLWLVVVSIAAAFKAGPKKIQVDFFGALDSATDWVAEMTEKHGREYALDKLRQSAEQASGIPIEYLYEKEIRDAKARNEANGVFFPLLEGE